MGDACDNDDNTECKRSKKTSGGEQCYSCVEREQVCSDLGELTKHWTKCQTGIQYLRQMEVGMKELEKRFLLPQYNGLLIPNSPVFIC